MRAPRSGLLAQMAAMSYMHLGVSAHAVEEPTTPSIRRGDTLVDEFAPGPAVAAASTLAAALEPARTEAPALLA